ncbi:MAG: Rne/Rng family ribonuclease [Candidatus Adiutrix sp.]|jgi:ribonuclease G|nr:Rne/Rng family ribonuclease [Candidatus Adiutrix sp.]
MSSELIINYRPYETRVALLENGTLVEFQVERGAQGAGLLGNIYRGRVLRVLPGMQAAFVDIGLEKAAFLYVDDVTRPGHDFERRLGRPRSDKDDDRELEETGEIKEETLPRPEPEAGEEPSPPIETLLSEGQEILVQISKEPIGQKGARVTTHISLPSRRLVLMPTMTHLGVSRRIEDEEERRRLKDSLESTGYHHGFIARTASEGASSFEIQAEAKFLVQLWQSIQEDGARVSAPAQVHQELDATLKSVRDNFTETIDRLVIDHAGQYESVKAFLEAFSPDLAGSLELYDGPEPVFHATGVDTELDRALNKKVWLKSGGYVVIESTEALTVIDVNTGRYVGRHNLEETILKTNLEAVKEIAYQLRLRNIGGLIVIDFIDMEKESNRERVYQALKDSLRRDKGKTKVLPMSELGLIEMTRKRTKENIDRYLREPCFYCQGQGFLLSKTSVCHEAFQDLEREAYEYPHGQLKLSVHPQIRDVILDEGRSGLEDLEKRLGRSIAIKADETLHLEEHVIEVLSEGEGSL